MNSKKWEWIREIYEINRFFLKNMAVLLAGICIYAAFFFDQEFVAGHLLQFSNVISVLELLDLGAIISLCLVFSFSLMAYSQHKTKKLFKVANLFLIASIIDTIAALYGMGQSGALFQDTIVIGQILSILGRLVIYFALYQLIIADDRSESTVKEQSFILYIPIVVTMGLFISEFTDIGDFISPYELKHYNFLFVLFEFILTACLLAMIAKSLKDNEKRQSKTASNAVAAIVFMLFAQVVMLNPGLYPEFDAVVFKTFKLLGIIALIRLFYKTYISDVLQSSRKEESQLRLYVDNLKRVVDKRTSELTEKNRQVLSELEYARVIQQSLLPPESQSFDEKVVFESGYFPCEKLSGDFFDIYPVDEEHVAMYLLDVSGHGIPAALLTMVCNNYVKSSERLIQRFRALKPHRSIQNLFEQFNTLNFPDELHMVIFFANFNYVTKELTYSSGGMNCFPIVFRADGSHEFLNDVNGFPICRLGDLFTPNYVSNQIYLYSGDTVLFYTDGLTDEEKNGIFNQESLIEFILRHRHLPLSKLNGKIKEMIYPEVGHLKDDITFFLMRV